MMFARVLVDKGGITLQLFDWQEYRNFLKWKEASEFLGRGYKDG
jgi:hypothetical protein